MSKYLDDMVEAYVDSLIFGEAAEYLIGGYAIESRAYNDCREFLLLAQSLIGDMGAEELGASFFSSRYEYGLGFLAHDDSECPHRDALDSIAYRFAPIRRNSR